MKKFEVEPIGKINVSKEGMFVELEQKYVPALKALDGFGHLNIIWWFSENDNKEARSVLEAPKPYEKSPDLMGIFATRSPFRPNPIALTAVQVIQINQKKGIIEIAYIDANNGTPVLDIKPYTPSLDRMEKPSVPKWCSHWPMSLEQSGNFNWENEFNF